MNVFTKAWEIAKEAVIKFGGKASEFFAEALRMAWVIKKGGNMKGSEKQIAWAEDIIKDGQARWNKVAKDQLKRYEDEVEHYLDESNGEIDRFVNLAMKKVDRVKAVIEFIFSDHADAELAIEMRGVFLISSWDDNAVDGASIEYSKKVSV